MNALRKTAMILLLALLAATARASDDPFVGTWVLDAASSQYPAGTCPESMVVEMKAAGNGVQYRSDAKYANGRVIHSEYTADYDGNQAIVMGSHGMMLPVFLVRIDSRAVFASLHEVAANRRHQRESCIQDGRRMTITTIATSPSGEKTTTIGVFNKQTPVDETR